MFWETCYLHAHECPAHPHPCTLCRGGGECWSSGQRGSQTPWLLLPLFLFSSFKVCGVLTWGRNKGQICFSWSSSRFAPRSDCPFETAPFFSFLQPPLHPSLLPFLSPTPHLSICCTLKFLGWSWCIAEQRHSGEVITLSVGIMRINDTPRGIKVLWC